MKKLNLLLLVLLLSSCASMPYGNFTPVSQGRDVYLAQDASSQLRHVYPPAQNTFCVGQKISDGFGINLIQDLRKKGYGVIENNCSKQKANFFYVVDEIKPSNLYRVSLYIGPQNLSRVYAKTNNKILPISAWTHKE